MIDLNNKDYVAVVQCHIVKERCSGYNCENASHERTGGFAAYPADKSYRMLNLTCGGCCGRAVQRKLSNLVRRIRKNEGIGKDRIVVQLASCLTKDNFHSSPCPHLEYIRGLIAKLGLDVCDDTYVNETSEKRREEGVYSASD
ncbi:MAG: CGGC domain-containing protein [Planctomycetota bacterium]|jgi:predicted metal-binding protein